MPAMTSKKPVKMANKVSLCTICSSEPCSDTTFRNVAEAMRVEYILTEYTNLSDAWRVYQGVALYREYQGLGGETRQLEVEPQPCSLCMVKIVNLAQSVFILTRTAEGGVVARQATPGSVSGAKQMEEGGAKQLNSGSNKDGGQQFNSVSNKEEVRQKTGVFSEESNSVPTRRRGSDAVKVTAFSVTTGVSGVSTKPSVSNGSTRSSVNCESTRPSGNSVSTRPSGNSVSTRPNNNSVSTKLGKSSVVTRRSGSTAVVATPGVTGVPSGPIVSSVATKPKVSKISTSTTTRPRRGLPESNSVSGISPSVPDTDIMITSVSSVSALPDSVSTTSPSSVSTALPSSVSSSTTSRPRRSQGRSLVDRNPDFQVYAPDLRVDGESEESDTQLRSSRSSRVDASDTQLKTRGGRLSTPQRRDRALVSSPQRRQVMVSPSSQEEDKEEAATSDDSFTTARDFSVLGSREKQPPSQVLVRPRRSGGRSLHERNPDFSLDLPLGLDQPPAKKARGGGKQEDEVDQENKREVEVDQENKSWISEEGRTEQLGRLDRALQGAGWSQAIRSGVNMEREVFSNSNNREEYVKGISRLVGHFARGSGEAVGSPKREQKSSLKITKIQKNAASHKVTEKWVKDPSPAVTSNSTDAQIKKVPKSHPVPKVRRTVPGSKVGKTMVTKAWSKTKVNCPVCGQAQSRSKIKEHMASVHPSDRLGTNLPCSACSFKAENQAALSSHISSLHADLDPEHGSLGEEETSSSESGMSSTRDQARNVRSQFQYIVKTSATGKQGRKYIEVGDQDLEKGRGVPLQKFLGTSNLIITPPRKTARKPKPTIKMTEAMGRRGGKEVMVTSKHYTKLGEVLVDELCGSNSETEITETKKTTGTLNAYYLDNDANANEEESKEGEATDDSAAKTRPQRRKRSIEDRNPDYVMSVPARTRNPSDGVKNTKVGDMNKKPQAMTDEKEKTEGTPGAALGSPSVARDWFGINQEDEF